MTGIGIDKGTHPSEVELAGFLAGLGKEDGRLRIEEHLSSCSRCLERLAAAHEAVAAFNKRAPHKKAKDTVMKRSNIYLLLAVISFSLSFVIGRYFLQLLAATLLFGIKWVADSRSSKTLIAIHESYKRDRISLK
ncbi:MAG: hypothetical protein V1682_06795 [Candidatus Omnitrophota bacterium]